MNDLSDIKRRLASIKQTRQITGAMETISVAKMRKSVELLENSREYINAIDGILKSFPRCADDETAAFFGEKKTGRPFVIVIAADRGLCGSFNNDVFKLAAGAVGEKTLIMPIGKVACERYNPRDVVSVNAGTCKRNEIYAFAKCTADMILKRYEEFSSVDMVYTQLITHASYAPKSVRLLPFATGDVSGEERGSVGEFFPSARAVFDRLVPLYLSGKIYGAIVNSRAAEDLARHTAMSAATRNADEMTDTLSAEYNRVRQSIVTRQITEMVGSTRALSED